MKKIKTIIRKEWAEVFKNRMVIFTVAFLPLLMTAIPLGILYSTRGTVPANGTATQLPAEMTQSMCPGGLSGADCFQVFMVSEFMMLFMIVPVAIPVTIAAYSIVGEKTTRSPGAAPGNTDHNLRVTGREMPGSSHSSCPGDLCGFRDFCSWFLVDRGK